MVQAFKAKQGAADSDVMFPGGSGSNPANKWVKKVTKFFNKKGLKVQSHDFRVTTATEMYEQTKDIVAVQQYLSHSDIKTTQRYVKKAKGTMLAQAGTLIGSRQQQWLSQPKESITSQPKKRDKKALSKKKGMTK